ncbi:hypothetical protein L7F22_002924 [Adiantum nelumboides]|nr:hypothetical protein [Adiantum nelumboides]
MARFQQNSLDMEVAAKRSPSKGLTLMGNDFHEGALSLCMKDAKAAGVHDLLELSCKACKDYSPRAAPSLVLVNPPWGMRLGMNSMDEPENVIPAWQELGKFLKPQIKMSGWKLQLKLRGYNVVARYHLTWHDFNRTLWRECWDMEVAAKRSPSKGLTLMGNDFHEGALSLCMKDAKAAGVHDLLELSCKACKDYSPHAAPSLVLVNPPWGMRLGMNSMDEPENVIPAWQELGKFLKPQIKMSGWKLQLKLRGYNVVARYHLV